MFYVDVQISWQVRDFGGGLPCSHFVTGGVNRDFWTRCLFSKVGGRLKRKLRIWLLLRITLAGLRNVNLDVQISWQAQYFVDLEMQIPWQEQHFVDLDVWISWRSTLWTLKCRFCGRAALCEP